MKILFLTDTFIPQINGVSISIKSFSEELENQGHDVTIIGPKTKDSPKSTDKVWRFKSIKFPFQPEYRMTSPLSKKLKNFEANHFDIIHIQTPFFMGHLGQFLGWKYDIPLIHTYHTFWADYLHYFPLLPKKLRKKVDLLLLSKNFCNRCNHIIAPSEPIKKTLIDYGVKKPIDILPSGINTTIEIKSKDTLAFKERWNIPLEKQVLVFVGRLGKEKNIYFLIDTFHSIISKHSNTHLLIIGDGPERDSLTTYIQSKNLMNHVTLTGYLNQKEVFEGISGASIITFPSTTETQGLSLIEGMHLGKPAVCINKLGVKEILKDNIGGFLTDGTHNHFVNAAIELLTDPKLYEKKSHEAKKRALDFSTPNVTKRLISIYEKNRKSE